MQWLITIINRIDHCFPSVCSSRNNFQQKKVQWNLPVIIFGLCICLSYTRLAKRALIILRPPSPKSPVASPSAFKSVEGSDEDVDVIENENANLDAEYLHTNGNVSPVASPSAFKSVEGSDEDVDVIENENANLDAEYLHTNGNVEIVDIKNVGNGIKMKEIRFSQD
nr:AMP deaminase [Tanacetum cinerariifolium]